MTPTKQGDKPKFVEAFEKDQEKTEKILQSFNIDDFIGVTDELRSVEIEGLGIVHYKKLSVTELLTLYKKLRDEKIDDPAEQGMRIIAAMLQKANANVTVEKYGKLPSDLNTKLMNVLGRESGFL